MNLNVVSQSPQFPQLSVSLSAVSDLPLLRVGEQNKKTHLSDSGRKHLHDTFKRQGHAPLTPAAEHNDTKH